MHPDIERHYTEAGGSAELIAASINSWGVGLLQPMKMQKASTDCFDKGAKMLDNDAHRLLFIDPDLIQKFRNNLDL